MYGDGDGVPQDRQEAFKWFLKGAELGNAGAAGGLGHAYQLGQGVVPDCDQAAKWLGIGAAKKDRVSLANFGMLYDQGCGVPHDEREALRLFHESANLGFGQAQFNLGVYYRDGRGTDPDPLSSYFWFSIVTREHLPQAQDRADKMRKLLTPAQIAEAERRLAQWKPAPAPEYELR
jgi:TPR repeat protein